MWRGELDTALSLSVTFWRSAVSTGTLISSINKRVTNIIAEILLKVVLNTNNQPLQNYIIKKKRIIILLYILFDDEKRNSDSIASLS